MSGGAARYARSTMFRIRACEILTEFFGSEKGFENSGRIGNLRRASEAGKAQFGRRADDPRLFREICYFIFTDKTFESAGKAFSSHGRRHSNFISRSPLEMAANSKRSAPPEPHNFSAPPSGRYFLPKNFTPSGQSAVHTYPVVGFEGRVAAKISEARHSIFAFGCPEAKAASLVPPSPAQPHSAMAAAAKHMENFISVILKIKAALGGLVRFTFGFQSIFPPCRGR